jgi:hypothetical protein
MTQRMKTAKSSKPAKTVKSVKTAQEVRDSINWNAKYYRDKERKFFESASYEAPSEPIVQKASKKEVKAVLVAAQKVRHNKTVSNIPSAKVVMINNVPHKLRDGKLVPMIPIAESQKWELA